jgi:hypothetical protein
MGSQTIVTPRQPGGSNSEFFSPIRHQNVDPPCARQPNPDVDAPPPDAPDVPADAPDLQPSREPNPDVDSPPPSPDRSAQVPVKLPPDQPGVPASDEPHPPPIIDPPNNEPGRAVFAHSLRRP